MICSVCFEFERYNTLGDKTSPPLPKYEIHWRLKKTDNPIVIIVKNLASNMCSKWEIFLTEAEKKFGGTGKTNLQINIVPKRNTPQL